MDTISIFAKRFNLFLKEEKDTVFTKYTTCFSDEKKNLKEMPARS